MHIHLDAVGGVAGDMFVAALLDAFPDLETRVMQDIAAVLPEEAGRGRLTYGMAGGLRALRFGLQAVSQDVEHSPDGHPHMHGHEHHKHGHTHYHAAEGTYMAFCRRIDAARLSPGTVEHAKAILERIARAEAFLHDMALAEVHFHELADWDALMDVVAAGSLVAALHEATWSVSPLPLGGGLVRTAHGLLPVPAPATAEILRGYAWRNDGIEGERVTPTGAAIVTYITAGRGNGTRSAGRLLSVGYGAGTKTFPGLPNILRACVFDTATETRETLTLIAFEVDDMTGEEIATAADHLRAVEGVGDVLLVAAQGKKGRPVTRFELQCDPVCADHVADAVFSQTATLGLRQHEVRRDRLTRSAETAPSGIRRKRAQRPGGDTTKAENDDLAGLPTLAIRRAAKTEAER